MSRASSAVVRFSGIFFPLMEIILSPRASAFDIGFEDSDRRLLSARAIC